MDKIRTPNKVKGKKIDNNLIGLFLYERDSIFLKDLIKKIKHIPFIKEMIHFLALYKDKDVPQLIFDFCRRRHTKGYRSSLILVLENYDCSKYIYDLLALFFKDSYNTTWYCYDLLVKYIRKTSVEDLHKFSRLITNHISKERDEDKKQYHELLLKKINQEIKRRG